MRCFPFLSFCGFPQFSPCLQTLGGGYSAAKALANTFALKCKWLIKTFLFWKVICFGTGLLNFLRWNFRSASQVASRNRHEEPYRCAPEDSRLHGSSLDKGSPGCWLWEGLVPRLSLCLPPWLEQKSSGPLWKAWATSNSLACPRRASGKDGKYHITAECFVAFSWYDRHLSGLKDSWVCPAKTSGKHPAFPIHTLVSTDRTLPISSALSLSKSEVFLIFRRWPPGKWRIVTTRWWNSSSLEHTPMNTWLQNEITGADVRAGSTGSHSKASLPWISLTGLTSEAWHLSKQTPPYRVQSGHST